MRQLLAEGSRCCSSCGFLSCPSRLARVQEAPTRCAACDWARLLPKGSFSPAVNSLRVGFVALANTSSKGLSNGRKLFLGLGTGQGAP